MPNKLYLECYSGISGDMTVAALLDLGADQQVLLEGLESLNLPGYQLKIGRVKKNGIDACDFDVILDEPEHDHEHHHDHEHEHHHHHDHEHHHHHDHVHRNIGDIFAIIDQSKISDRAKQTAKDIFRIIAAAESKAHGIAEDQVHFHEVGAVDSIVDIVSAAICLDNLDITERLYLICMKAVAMFTASMD